ncbi:MAG: hypothetical protein J0M08_06905 [Bacteroidetes bacterium]|nr:hypothetical protein [Bacteroidota bacterium]
MRKKSPQINSSFLVIFVLFIGVYYPVPFSAQTRSTDSISAIPMLASRDSLFDKKNINIPLRPRIDRKKSIYQRNEATKRAQSFFKKRDVSRRNLLQHSGGSISLGYEYGWLPYAMNSKIPVGNYKAEGDISFSAFNMPLKLNFFYSDVRYNTGLNNNFRISYDINAYKEEQIKKISQELVGYKNEVSNMQEQEQVLKQKLFSMQSQKVKLDLEKNIPKVDKPTYNKPSLNTPGLTGINAPQTPALNQTPSIPFTDSLKIDSLDIKSVSIDSSRIASKGKFTYDTVTTKINEYQAQLNKVQSSLAEKRETINKLQELAKNPLANNPFASKKENFLSGIKKLEIGLCYPTYSTFLVNNLPVKGVNVQHERNNWFTAFTCGTTVSNLLFSAAPVQNILQNTKNLYNTFDFTNLQDGRKIAAVKTGWGKKENTHVHFGFLYGTGLTSYIRNPENNTIPPYGTERNTVVELDIKYEFSKNHSIDVIYGKSTLQDISLGKVDANATIQRLTENNHSNAALIRYNGFLVKSKTRLTYSTRYIEPFFRSFGIAYMRSDNLRHEARVEQQINSKLKYTGTLRYDTDNLLNLYQYKTRMYTWGNSVQWKVNRRLNIRLIYNPVWQHIDTGVDYWKNKNGISNVVVSYVPKTENASVQLTAMYGYYRILSDSFTVNFQNITVTEQTQLNNGVRVGFTSTWYKNSQVDSIFNNTLINVLEGGYQFKKGTVVSIAAKGALYDMKQFQTGFSAKANFGLIRNFAMELQAEKIVTGEYYNLFNQQQSNNFPFYFMGRLIFQW